jgi:hypothetical protein
MSEGRYSWLTLFNRMIVPAMPKKLPDGLELVRVKDAAPYFDMHERTLRKKIRSGEVATITQGPRKTYIAREEIIRYWKENSKIL